jgi:hypothetical protein
MIPENIETSQSTAVAQPPLVLPLPGFTPGPWDIKPTPIGSFGKAWKEIVSGSKPVIHAGSFDRTRNGETETECGVVISDADARAIAAVPQMFAALERLEKACNAVHEVSGGTPQHEAMWLAQLEARDAITEATGISWQNASLSHGDESER